MEGADSAPRLDKEWLDSVRKLLQLAREQSQTMEDQRDLGLLTTIAQQRLDLTLEGLSKTVQEQTNRQFPMQVRIPHESRLAARNLASLFFEGPPTPESRAEWSKTLADRLEAFKKSFDPMHDAVEDLQFHPKTPDAAAAASPRKRSPPPEFHEASQPTQANKKPAARMREEDLV